MRRTIWNVPNVLTLIRIVSIPVLMLLAFSSWKQRFIASSILFFAASATDWLDGFLARRLNQTSAFGRFLDPVADKLMVAAALMILVDWHHSIWLVVPAIVIVAREITISALREWMAEMGKRASVAVSYIGKLKTTFQMMAIGMLLAHKPIYDAHGDLMLSVWDELSYSLLYVAVLLTIWSMMMYLRAAWPDLKHSGH